LPFFAFGFAKGYLLGCESLPFRVQKDTFCEVKGKLSEAKMGKRRTILCTFRSTNKCPKICKPRFLLSINALQNGLKTRVFRAEGKVF
jgi:hypothetical protein